MDHKVGLKFFIDTRAAVIAFLLITIFLFLAEACLFSPSHDTHPKYFSTDTAGLADAKPMGDSLLVNGDSILLQVAAVNWRATPGTPALKRLGFNAQIPGPLLHLQQGSTVYIGFRADPDLPGGLRFRGIFPESSQSGSTTWYKINPKVPGMFPYQMSYRCDYTQEMGLMGALVVSPSDSSYWPPDHREIHLILDDMATSGVAASPFSRETPTFVLSGHYGNNFTVNGQIDFQLEARRGEHLRFQILNMANARVFNLALRGIPLRVLGADQGRFERAYQAKSEPLAPGERVVFDVIMPDSDSVVLEHRMPLATLPLGRISLSSITNPPLPVLTSDSLDTIVVRGDFNFNEARDRLVGPPDKELVVTLDPKSQIKMTARSEALPLFKSHVISHGPDDITLKGIVWNDNQVEENAASNGRNVHWILRDPATLFENEKVIWHFKLGSQIRIRLYNEVTSIFPTPHPLSFGGLRFLVLRENARINPNIVYKDAFLLGQIEVTDVLLLCERSGTYFIESRIPEQAEAGMRTIFTVD